MFRRCCALFGTPDVGSRRGLICRWASRWCGEYGSGYPLIIDAVEGIWHAKTTVAASHLWWLAGVSSPSP